MHGPRRSLLPLVALFGLALTTRSDADTAHIAQPWRAEAVVMGRDEAYDRERFLHELTFRHQPFAPTPIEEGIRGTGGSVSSDRLYYEFRFLRDFGFRDDHSGFLLDIQRAEDLDGGYDRQVLGFRQNLGQHSALWLRGDVFSDKAITDIYLGGRHHFSTHSWMHASWIFPDALFNDKSRNGDTFDREPQTVFLQFHRQSPAGDSSTTLSINLSPESRFNSQQEDLTVESESLRAALTHFQNTGDWLFELHAEGERTRRQYRLLREDEQRPADFERDHLQLRAAVTFTRHSLAPKVGLAYRALDEDGYFGRSLDDLGHIRRREPTLFGELSFRLTNRTTLSPGLYLSVPDIEQSFDRHEDLHHSGFLGKLTLPFNIRLPGSDQAVLTINPTFYLHTAAFGGGNLQLHWPL